MSRHPAWKKAERRAAAFLGCLTGETDCKRTPLSGGNGRISRSDSDHTRLFIESKQRNNHSAWTIFDGVRPLARKENKLPVVALFRKRSPGALICVHTEDLAAFCQLVMGATPKRKKKKALLT